MQSDAFKILAAFCLLANALPVLLNYRKAVDMFWTSPHYIFFSPTYIHLLVIYAFCRIDDLSWGTKGK